MTIMSSLSADLSLRVLEEWLGPKFLISIIPKEIVRKCLEAFDDRCPERKRSMLLGYFGDLKEKHRE